MNKCHFSENKWLLFRNKRALFTNNQGLFSIKRLMALSRKESESILSE